LIINDTYTPQERAVPLIVPRMGWNIDSLFEELSELEGKVTALEKVLKTQNANSEELL
jgi:hypothetical protein